jgi:3D (Asp-Asp-Asp) domain-containing protein
MCKLRGCGLILTSALFAQENVSISAPDLSALREVSFWATSYWVHHAETEAIGVPLQDMAGLSLGPVLSQKDWCAAALEGTVRVGNVTYNYAGTQHKGFTDCSKFFKPAVGYTRFKVSKGSFGDGVSGFVLVPYRTIAADPAFLRTGTVLFIPSAVGQTLPGGRKHDGYFFVADRGGSIKGKHIDIFQGDQIMNFSFIVSKAKPLFKGYVVTAPEASETLSRMHKAQH